MNSKHLKHRCFLLADESKSIAKANRPQTFDEAGGAVKGLKTLYGGLQPCPLTQHLTPVGHFCSVPPFEDAFLSRIAAGQLL